MITNGIAAVFTVGYLGTTFWICRGFRFSVKTLCLGAISIAMTLVLAYIYIPLPTGASITAGSWIPLMLLALICDPRLAMLSGMVCGILAPVLLPGWTLAHWAQLFLEYLAIFSCMGYAGLFGYGSKRSILLGAGLAILLRFAAQVLSGAVFFGQYAWEGWSAWGYSLFFHLSGKLPEGILTVAILLRIPIPQLAERIKKEVS